jgi:DNA invertase Pin-like site-specific DNA recombinase
MLTVMGAFAELERAMIRERQAEGIAIAKAKGTYRRTAKLAPEQLEDARERIALGVPKAQVARDLGVSRTTLYNALEGKGIYAEGEGQR